MVTKDGYMVVVGDWLWDANGIYEVKSVDRQFAYLREIEFEDDSCENWHHANAPERRLTSREIKNLFYM